MKHYLRLVWVTALALAIALTMVTLSNGMPVRAGELAPVKGTAAVLQEGFDNSTFPPTGWQAITLTGSYNWVRATTGVYPAISPHGGAGMARYGSYDAPSGNQARLSTPALDLTTLSQPRLKFWMYQDSGYSARADTITVEVSLDGGTTYTAVLGAFPRYNATSGWKLRTIDLSAYADQSNVRIGFRAWSDNGNDLHLDDVTVGDPIPDYSPSTKTASPASGTTVSSGQRLTYTVVVSNAGDLTGTAWLNDPIPAGAQYVPGSATFSRSNQPVVDGGVDAVYGAPIASDSSSDGNNNANMDLLNLYVTSDPDFFYVAFTVDGDLGAANWGKYALYIDTTNDEAGATTDAWGRSVSVNPPHRPEYGIYSWVDSLPYGVDDIELYGWGGSSWSNVGTIDGAALSAGTVSTIEWKIARSRLGNPSQIWVEVWDTGGTTTDNAQDTINAPEEDWNATDWSSPATLANSTAYVPASGIQWQGALEPGQRVTVTYAVTTTAISGFVTNTATISDALLAAPVVRTVGHPILLANYNTSVKGLSGRIHPGERLTYTIQVINSSAAAGTATTVTDSIPTGAIYAGGAAVAGGGTLTADESGFTWTGMVPGNGRITVTLPVTLTGASGSWVTNTVFINDVVLSAPVSKTAGLQIHPSTGGPDARGYTYKDRYAPDGPTFTWVPTDTATKLATLTSGTADDGFYSVVLPFNFTFYTQTYTAIYPSTNGLVGFGAGSAASSNATIPTAAVPNNFATCYWDNLRNNVSVPTEGIFYEVQGTAPNRTAILTFVLEDTAYTAGAFAPYIFQMHLREGSNQILCNYLAMDGYVLGDGQSATVGLENAAGNGGLLYAYNKQPGAIENDLAILFSPAQLPMYDLSSKTVQPTGMVYPGQLLTYTTVLRNIGGVDGAAAFSDPIPAGTVFESILPGDSQPTFDGTAVVWNNPLARGATVTLTHRVTVVGHPSGWITNTATISDPLVTAPLVLKAVNSVAVPAYGSSTKSVAPSGQVNSGQLLTYTIVLYNNGQLSSTAMLNDPLPAGTSYVPGSALVQGGGTLSDTHGITWSGLVTASGRVTVTFNALVTALSGSITNTATISDPLILAPVVKTAVNSVASPNLSTSSKTASVNAVSVGGSFNYFVAIRNSGSLTTTGATMSDLLPPELTTNPAQVQASAGTVEATASSVNWSGSITPGATVYVTIPVTLVDSRCNVVMTNTATISDPVLPASLPIAAPAVSTYAANSRFIEGFDSPTFPPTGWMTSTVVFTNGTVAPLWTQVTTTTYPTTIPYGGIGMLKFNSFNSKEGNAARLSSPAIDLAAYSSPHLVLAMYHDSGYPNKSDRVQVQVSTDGGTSYANIGNPILRYAAVNEWQLHAVDLSAYAGQTIRIGLLALSDYGNNMYVDSVSLRSCCDAPAGASFTFDPPSPLANEAINFTGSVLTGTAPLTYTWDFSEGAPVEGNPASHTYTADGTYPITMTVANRCGSTVTYGPVQVLGTPVAPEITLTGSSSAILGQAVYFTGTLLAGSTPVTYSWDFGDGTLLDDGLMQSHIYTATGQYTVTLTATNGVGTDSESVVVRIGALPAASFVGPQTPINGTNTTVVFTDTSTNATARLWNFGDGVTSTLQNPSHTYPVPAAQSQQGYTVTLTAINEYGTAQATQRVTFTNYFPAFSGIKVGPPSAVNLGAPLFYTIRVTNTGKLTTSAASLVDTFPQGASGPATEVTVSSGSVVSNTGTGLTWKGELAPGAGVTLTFNLALTATCGGSVLTNTAVLSDPLATSSLTVRSASSAVYKNLALNEGFDAVTFPSTGWITAVVANTGTYGTPAWTRVTLGSSPSVYPHSGAGMAKFNSYTADSGDAARLASPVLTLTTPAAFNFWMYHDVEQTEDDSMLVQVSTDGGTNYTTLATFKRYTGSTGWQSHSVSLNAYAGQSIRVALLAVSDYGSNMYVDDLTISEPCIVCDPPTNLSFSYAPAAPRVGQVISFTGSASGTLPLTFDWNFGDGGTGSGPAVSHAYTTAGSYTATMTATGTCGYAVYTRTVTVEPGGCLNVEGVDFTWTPANPMQGQAVTFNSTVLAGTGPLNFSWDFGDGAGVMGEATITHTFPLSTTETDYTVTLVVANPCSFSTPVQKPVHLAILKVYLPLVLRSAQQ